MKSKRIFRTENVEQVRVAELLPLLVTGCLVAVDVAKAKFVVALATWEGEVVKLFRFEHPTETRQFLAIVAALKAAVLADKLRVVMEPTGTYGDAIRHQVLRLSVPVHMVSPKKTHDCREVFDGVPSSHDPKSASLIAKLSAMGLSREWTPPSSTHTSLRAIVDLRRHSSARREANFGQLEALLARHWPEFSQWLDLRTQKTSLKTLEHFQGPEKLGADAVRARAFLEQASRRQLSSAALDGIVAGATASLGVPMQDEESRLVEMLTKEVLDATASIEKLDAELQRMTEQDDVLGRLAPWMGSYTAAVIVTMCDPRKYASASQLEKACGLNMRETSSGEHRGRVAITKRGPGIVRQVLYLFALRTIHHCAVTRAWYTQRRGYTEVSKSRAVVALMRKLVKAMFHVARGEVFDPMKLFDARRLDTTKLTPPEPSKSSFAPRTTPRAIARRKRGGASSASTST